jgi:hypothetical protein
MSNAKERIIELEEMLIETSNVQIEREKMKKMRQSIQEY